jgi:sigma-B regulation protein RsbU (phosphoserine phosphatase)
MAYFIIGIAVGALVVAFFYLSLRREILEVDEDRQYMKQEKQIVVEFMHNLVEAIGEGVAREELFQRIVHAAILSTGALSACLFERTADDHLQGVAAEGLFPPHRPLPPNTRAKLATRAKFIEQVLKSEVFSMGEGVVGAVAKTGEAVLIEDASKDPRIIKHEDEALRVRSIIVAPILFRKKVLGALAVVNPADGSAFTDTDFSLVQSLAEQAGMAIHNSDFMSFQIEKSKLDLDLSLASSIQGMLLPRAFPEYENLDIGALYEPAQKVGGDLYDVLALSPSRVGLAIADVSGKGIPASLLMAICQTNLRHYARMYDSPAEVLRALNREMTEEMREDMFITIIYSIIDTEKQTLTLARAGHELPFLIHSTREPRIEPILSEGMALGMVPSEIFDPVIADTSVPFVPGDGLILYTDGLTEATNAEKVEFSSQRLMKAILTLRGRSANELNAGILETLKRFRGTDILDDDVTLTTVKYKS